MSQAEIRFDRACKELERIATRLRNQEHDERTPENLRERVLQLRNYLDTYIENNDLTEEETGQLFDAAIHQDRIKGYLENQHQLCLSCGDELMENWDCYGYTCPNCD